MFVQKTLLTCLTQIRKRICTSFRLRFLPDAGLGPPGAMMHLEAGIVWNCEDVAKAIPQPIQTLPNNETLVDCNYWVMPHLGSHFLRFFEGKHVYTRVQADKMDTHKLPNILCVSSLCFWFRHCIWRERAPNISTSKDVLNIGSLGPICTLPLLTFLFTFNCDQPRGSMMIAVGPMLSLVAYHAMGN